MHQVQRLLRATGLLLALLCVAPGSAEERIIYRCVDAGVTSYSDTPCGPAAQVYSRAAGVSVGAKPVPAAPAAREPRPVVRPQRRVERIDTQRIPTGQTECQRLQAQLTQLRSRMRAGYGVAEGERLREQQRAARARVRALRCGA